MKGKTICGAVAAVLVAGRAEADFLGVAAMDELLWPAWDLGLRVCRVYAVFDRPEDGLFAVWDTAGKDSTLVVRTDDSAGFYQHPFGNDLRPPPELVHEFPELALDTFVTIDLEGRLGPWWPGFARDALALDDTGWLTTPMGLPCDSCAGPDGRVLIGQFTVGAGAVVEGEGLSFLVHVGGGYFEAAGQSFFAPAVVGDFDGDGNVGSADLMQLIDGWGLCTPCNRECPDTDADCDAGIDDLLRLLSNWGNGAP